MKLPLPLLAVVASPLIFLTGCITAPIGVNSSRSLDFSPSRFAKGGSVCVMSEAKIKRVYPTAAQAKEEATVEQWFVKKGFTIQKQPRGADYGFMYVSALSPMGSTSGTVYGNSVYLDPTRYVHQVAGYLYELKPNGGPGRTLWSGTATCAGVAGSGPDVPYNQGNLLSSLLIRFPN